MASGPSLQTSASRNLPWNLMKLPRFSPVPEVGVILGQARFEERPDDAHAVMIDTDRMIPALGAESRDWDQ